ncbi:uncharacterized protein EI97DRAFT_186888 [Westerdykella ornata]|uniref:Uncharacterized protein n=1 Tax=Westerdykella ornata TaxID=318751 RepID=A0A6A6JU72_WESOR|nr:uncharacterized protein EI97DRAFT_186888 [Westerdykella ornata]KAF2279774.1 hypothetical protein EI97DRAFT_186888 [Westerdykella ornata]
MKASRWAPKEEPAQDSAAPAPTVSEISAPPYASVQTETAPSEPLQVDTSTTDAYNGTTYDHSYSDPSMDPFAQTAGTDDLFFDDDIVPIDQPVVEETPTETPQPTPVETPPPPGPAQQQGQHHAPRGASNGDKGARGNRGRGRGGRGGRGRGGGLNNSHHAPTEPKSKPAEQQDITKPQEANNDGTPAATPATTTDTASPPPSAPASSTPVGPKDTTKAPTSVRGDRTLTGGPKRSRLTEEELNAKLASMRAKNETLAAQHARAEADLASFEAREAAAAKEDAERKRQQAERQRIDRQNRQQMMGEREKNRQRKLDAMQGRAWDNEKEEGFAGTGEERRTGAARGAYGGVAPSPRQVVEDAAAQVGEDGLSAPQSYRGGRGRGRGRGGRGGRGGGGRGDFHGPPQAGGKPEQPQQPPSASDFPELPSATPTSATAKPENGSSKKPDWPAKTKAEAVKAEEKEGEQPGMKKQDSFGLSPAEAGKSWADQFEDSQS